jgi:hypothetical protein
LKNSKNRVRISLLFMFNLCVSKRGAPLAQALDLFHIQTDRLAQ